MENNLLKKISVAFLATSFFLPHTIYASDLSEIDTIEIGGATTSITAFSKVLLEQSPLGFLKETLISLKKWPEKAHEFFIHPLFLKSLVEKDEQEKQFVFIAAMSDATKTHLIGNSFIIFPMNRGDMTGVSVLSLLGNHSNFLLSQAREELVRLTSQYTSDEKEEMMRLITDPNMINFLKALNAKDSQVEDLQEQARLAQERASRDLDDAITATHRSNENPEAINERLDILYYIKLTEQRRRQQEQEGTPYNQDDAEKRLAALKRLRDGM